MARLYKKVRQKVALPPGTLAEREDYAGRPVRISVFDYTEQGIEEKTDIKIEDCFGYKDTPSVTWINVEGINVDVIKKIDGHFGIHPLVAEDIINLGQRPKVEDYDDYVFIVIKMIYFDKNGEDLMAEQISLLVGSNYVISFQECEGDVFDPIRDRLRLAKGRIRSLGADFLAYALLDAIVDHYFVLLEKIGMKMEALEERLMTDGNQDQSRAIHRQKRDMVFLRKQIWPVREVLSSLRRDELKLFSDVTRVYLRDVYDHTIQVMDTVESFRDMLTGLHDMHMTVISTKMNEVMKVLTVFATIFIPLTFIAGIYGMNFDYMPELHWKWGYYVLLGLMTAAVFGMIFFFRKKKWL